MDRAAIYFAICIILLGVAVGNVHYASDLTDEAIEKDARPRRIAATWVYIPTVKPAHPLEGCTWIAQANAGEIMKARCTPAADLTARRQ